MASFPPPSQFTFVDPPPLPNQNSLLPRGSTQCTQNWGDRSSFRQGYPPQNQASFQQTHYRPVATPPQQQYTYPPPRLHHHPSLHTGLPHLLRYHPSLQCTIPLLNIPNLITSLHSHHNRHLRLHLLRVLMLLPRHHHPHRLLLVKARRAM